MHINLSHRRNIEHIQIPDNTGNWCNALVYQLVEQDQIIVRILSSNYAEHIGVELILLDATVFNECPGLALKLHCNIISRSFERQCEQNKSW